MREGTMKEKEDVKGTNERGERQGKEYEEMRERSDTCQLCKALGNAQFSQDKYSKC